MSVASLRAIGTAAFQSSFDVSLRPLMMVKPSLFFTSIVVFLNTTSQFSSHSLPMDNRFPVASFLNVCASVAVFVSVGMLSWALSVDRMVCPLGVPAIIGCVVDVL